MKLIDQFRPRLLSRIHTIRDAMGHRPRVFCLVTGSPRSGTTAVVKWLKQQEGVTALSESRVLLGSYAVMREVHRFKKLERKEPILRTSARNMTYDNYARICNYKSNPILIDKEPLEPIALPDLDYADFISCISSIMPEAKILFMLRDPVSTVWSMTQRKWGYSLTEGEPRTFTLEEHIENWCACADIILASAGTASTYVCQYGVLTSAPERESARIGAFLGIPNAQPFQPKPSDNPAFDADALALITTMTASRIEALAAAGLTEL